MFFDLIRSSLRINKNEMLHQFKCQKYGSVSHVIVPAKYYSMEFFINVSLNSSNSATKNFCFYSKRAQTCHLLCKRPAC